MKMLVDPKQLSRIDGLKDQEALRVARVVTPLLILITYLCLLPLGTFAHALIPADAIADSDHVMLYLLGTAEVLGPGLSSFFLLVLLSAAMSSLDSVLLVAASSMSRDVIITGGQDQKAIRQTRLWVVVLSLASMLATLNPFAGIVQITAFSGSLYAACFLPTMPADAGVGALLETRDGDRRAGLRLGRLDHRHRLVLRQSRRMDSLARSVRRNRRGIFGLRWGVAADFGTYSSVR